MYDLFFNMAFHRTGKPRGWLRFVLFKGGSTARPIFHRIVHKKNGRVRPRFAYWVKPAALTSTKSKAELQTTTIPDPLRAEELVLQALAPFETTVEKWRGRNDPVKLIDKEALIAQILERPGLRLLVAASQDNYREVQGGVQLCVQHEERMAADHGFSYLQIHPWYPLPRLAHREADPDCIVSAILDGKGIGACRMSQLIATVQELSQAQTRDVSLAIHHMMGHMPEQLANLALATGSGRCVFWLHDFFSICPSYTLQRNTIAFCNAPDIESNACSLCLFGKERKDHQVRMADFFSKVRVDIASPSKVTAALWQEKSGVRASSVTVVPHTILDFKAKSEISVPARTKITIGYLGAPVQHKGWPVFTNLMHLHADTSEYRFVVMSDTKPRLGEDAWLAVSVSAQSPAAMSEAVEKADIDIVLHWPSWPETFSFTAHEALAGYAYVLTNSGSGNVAASVELTGRGTVLRDDADLLAFFTDGRAQALVKTRRAAAQTTEITAQPSRMSYFLLEKAL